MFKARIDELINSYKNADKKIDFLWTKVKFVTLIIFAYVLFYLGFLGCLLGDIFGSLFGDTSKTEEFLKQHKKSNNKLVFFINNRKNILIGLASLAFTLGLSGYIVSDKTDGLLNVFNSTIALFFGEFKDDENPFIDFAKTLAILCVSFGAIFLFFKSKINDWIVKNVQKKPYALVIGLSSQNRHYLNSLDDKKDSDKPKTDIPPTDSLKFTKNSTLIIEADTAHNSVERYQKMGFGVISSKAEDAIEKLHIENLTNCLISTGNDRRNIALALKLVEKIPPVGEDENPQPRQIYVRVDNKDLSVLFQKDFNIANSQIQIERGVDIIPHSLQTIICRQLFKDHSILGLQTDVLQTGQPFNIIVVGASRLSSEIIYHLAILAHLPEENHLTIHLIDKNAVPFCRSVEKCFTGISKIPQLTLKPLELDSDSLEFFENQVWQTSNLTNIIIATDDEDKNLDIAVNLQDTTYIQQTTNNQGFRTNVLFAIFDHAGLGKKIDDNKDAFTNFYTFASLDQASKQGNLIDEELELIAKLSHFHGYEGCELCTDEDVDRDAVNEKWIPISLHEKESNRSQALHINTKLLSLGLGKVKSEAKTLENRYKANQAIFSQALANISPTKKVLSNDEEANSSRPFDSPLDKLSRAEHNRWNAFHYLRGWQYKKVAEKEEKKSKLHKCLLPLEDFDQQLFDAVYEYDQLAVLNIPLYLAHAGYEIIPSD